MNLVLRRVALLLCVLAGGAGGAGCVIFRRPLTLPNDDVPTLIVASGSLGEPLSKVARHAWFAMRGAGETQWERWEVWGDNGVYGWVNKRHAPPLDDVGGGGVMVHGVFRGARATRMIDCVRRASATYAHAYRYTFWPGPNSNTYVETMLRRCDIHVDLPATAVGKDWRGWIGVSWTSGGTGVQFETPIFGLKLGLTEGIEVHLFTLAFGVDLWPPAILLPFEEGRIGFDDR